METQKSPEAWRGKGIGTSGPCKGSAWHGGVGGQLGRHAFAAPTGIETVEGGRWRCCQVLEKEDLGDHLTERGWNATHNSGS